MDSVQARHEEVHREEQRHVTCLRAVERAVVEGRVGKEVLGEVVVVFGEFEDEKENAQGEGRDQEQDEGQAFSLPCGVDRHCHRQAAGQQDAGVDRAEPVVGLLAAHREGIRVDVPQDRVGQEQAAEEQQFGDQKHPHPERRRLALLVGVVEGFAVRASADADGGGLRLPVATAYRLFSLVG